MQKVRNWLQIIFNTHRERGPFCYFQLAYLAHTLTTILVRLKVPKAKAIQAQVAAWFDREIVVRNQVGVFSVNPKNDSLTKSIPTFEYKHHDWLAVPEQRGVFLDIGANIGFYSLLAVTRFGYQTAHAFEPNPDSFARLQSNVSLNELTTRIHTHALALGAEATTAELSVRAAHTGASSFVSRGDQSWPTVSVPVETLDAVLNQKSIAPADITFIKIDVEGYELETLRGMRATLPVLPPGCCIFIEIHPRSKDGETSHQLLLDAGFAVTAETTEHNFLYQKLT